MLITIEMAETIIVFSEHWNINILENTQAWRYRPIEENPNEHTTLWRRVNNMDYVNSTLLQSVCIGMFNSSIV